MRNVLKLLALLLSVCLLMCLCACDQSTNATENTLASTGATEATDNTTEATSATVDDGKVTYTVTVTDEKGNPIAGAMVQLCKDACVPAVTDAKGVATYSVAEDNYKVSFLTMPAGYTYTTEETEFYFASGETAMTIVLKAA